MIRIYANSGNSIRYELIFFYNMQKLITIIVAVAVVAESKFLKININFSLLLWIIYISLIYEESSEYIKHRILKFHFHNISW